MGDMQKALDFFQKDISPIRLWNSLRPIQKANPSKTAWPFPIQNSGSIHQAMGDMEKALDFFQKFAQLGLELFEANPKSEALKNGLAISYSKLGDIHQAMGDMQKALDFFQKRNCTLGIELFEANPKSEALKNGLAISYSKLGEIHQAMGDMQKALDFFQKFADTAISLGLELFEANPKSESLKNGLAISYSKLGEIHQAMGDMQKALDFFQKETHSIQVWNSLRPIQKANPSKTAWPFPIQNSGRSIRPWAICRRPWISFKKKLHSSLNSLRPIQKANP